MTSDNLIERVTIPLRFDDSRWTMDDEQDCCRASCRLIQAFVATCDTIIEKTSPVGGLT